MRFAVALLLVCSAWTVGCKRSQASTDPSGRELFASTCARCHGEGGSGGLPLYAGGPSPRNFRDHAFQASRSDAEIRAVIVGGKGAGMPAFGRTFDEAQLGALVRYLRSLDSESAR